LKNISKPRVVISRCIGFDKCRYDASGVESSAVREIIAEVNPIPICPEVEIGLTIPRDRIFVVLLDGKFRLIQPSSGRDLTSKIKEFSLKFLKSIPSPDGFILKSKSPSCGIGRTKVFDNSDYDIPVAFGYGFFAKAVRDVFPALAVESEETLKDTSVKREFMRKIRVSASSREK
jgi:uncharacterized protein YbbK (DUF523 family)